MNFKEYSELAARTDRKDLNEREHFAHAACMLYSERYELWRAAQKDAVAEAGDVFWAVAKLARLTGLVDRLSFDDLGKEDYVSCDTLITMTQKYFQGHKPDPEKVLLVLQSMLAEVEIRRPLHLNATMSQIAELNIEKLKKRYPDGFSEERSINRTE